MMKLRMIIIPMTATITMDGVTAGIVTKTKEIIDTMAVMIASTRMIAAHGTSTTNKATVAVVETHGMTIAMAEKMIDLPPVTPIGTSNPIHTLSLNNTARPSIAQPITRL